MPNDGSNYRQREYVEIVRTCGDHLMVLINDILDFSKIEAGKLELEMIDFDLRIAIEEVGDILAIEAAKTRSPRSAGGSNCTAIASPCSAESISVSCAPKTPGPPLKK